MRSHRDMTDDRHLFAPLMEADNMEALQAHGVETAKRIVHRVTHDFNNLIAVVRGYAAVL